MAEPLLSTKLAAPRPNPAVVARSRLLAHLARVTESRLAIVAAPAGFGKTTLAAAFAAEAARRGQAIAWVTLDDGDNDDGRFWGYVLAALEQACAGVGRQSRALLTARDSARPRESMLTVLINDLGQCPADVILILDDYHVVTRAAIHGDLAFLIENVPPNVHVVLVAREEPSMAIAHLRAGGDLVEVGAAELRFTTDETATFLRDTLGVALTAADVAAIDARTEGWVTGLQLAALSMRDRQDLAGFLASFSGSHRFVFDYLAEEVLAQRDDATREFLLGTSILDRLSGPLCDAVTDRAGSQEILAGLAAASLFLVPLDDERTWYRYHRLFADFLRARLAQREAPERVVTLHRRAAAWYGANDMPSQAVAHMLAAGAYHEAAELIDATADATWTRGRYATLIDRIDALPAAILATRPHLLLQRALAVVLSGQALERVEPSLAAALAAPRATDDAVLHARSAVVRAALAGVSADADGAIHWGSVALATLPEGDLAWRGIAQIDVGLAHAARAEFGAAARAFVVARALGDAAGSAYAMFVASVNLARARDMDGQLHEAHRAYRAALDLAERAKLGRVPLIGLAHVGLGDLAREWDDLAAAEIAMREGIRLATIGPRVHVRSAVAGWLALVRVLLALGRLDEAEDALSAADDMVRYHGREDFAPYVTMRAARLALYTGDLAAVGRHANALATDVGRLATGGLGGAPAARAKHRDLALLIAHLRLALGDPATAVRWLEALAMTDAATPESVLRSVIETDAMLALARDQLGDPASAITALRRAVIAAEPEGFIRTFADHGAPMAACLRALAEARAAGATPEPSTAYLAALTAAASASIGEITIAARSAETLRAGASVGIAPSSASGGPERVRMATDDFNSTGPPLREPLSEREREVLALIADGASNHEIAERLVIALSTVKTHINHVFGKLGVRSRTQAIARGRQLGLLD